MERGEKLLVAGTDKALIERGMAATLVESLRSEKREHIHGEAMAGEIDHTGCDAVAHHHSLTQQLLIIADGEKAIGYRIAGIEQTDINA